MGNDVIRLAHTTRAARHRAASPDMGRLASKVDLLRATWEVTLGGPELRRTLNNYLWDVIEGIYRVDVTEDEVKFWTTEGGRHFGYSFRLARPLPV